MPRAPLVRGNAIVPNPSPRENTSSVLLALRAQGLAFAYASCIDLPRVRSRKLPPLPETQPLRKKDYYVPSPRPPPPPPTSSGPRPSLAGRKRRSAPLLFSPAPAEKTSLSIYLYIYIYISPPRRRENSEALARAGAGLCAPARAQGSACRASKSAAPPERRTNTPASPSSAKAPSSSLPERPTAAGSEIGSADGGRGLPGGVWGAGRAAPPRLLPAMTVTVIRRSLCVTVTSRRASSPASRHGHSLPRTQ
jgi:hypothetical protein